MRTVSSKEKWSYAIGNMPFSVKDAAFANFVVFYYTQVQGLSGTLTGLAFFISLCWDALTDPIVGSWSDSIRSKWGRRHPLMLGGLVPTSLLFLALFSPPDGLGNTAMFLWLLSVSILLRSCLTFYYIPYSALGAELSNHYDERTVIAKSRVTMGWVAGMALPAIAFAFFFPTENGLDGRLVAANYHQYGQLSLVVALATGLICVVGTWSVIPRLPKSDPEHRFTWAAPFTDMMLAFENRNFRLSMGANLVFGISTGAFVALSLYLGTYFWEFSTEQLAGVLVPTAVGTAAAFFSLSQLAKRFDKPVLLIIAGIAMAINSVWFIGARLAGLLPENGNDLVYLLFLLSTGMSVFITVCLQSLALSFIADILDEQQLATGKRQEGVMFAAVTFVQKATIGVGTLVAGFVIDFAGIVPGMIPGEVDSNVLNSLGTFTVLVTCSLAIIASFFYSKLSLSRQQHASLRSRLDAQTESAALANRSVDAQ